MKFSSGKMFLFSAEFSTESQMPKVNYIFSNVISIWLSQTGRFIHPARQKEMCIIVTLLTHHYDHIPQKKPLKGGQAYLVSVSELRWSIGKGRHGSGCDSHTSAYQGQGHTLNVKYPKPWTVASIP